MISLHALDALSASDVGQIMLDLASGGIRSRTFPSAESEAMPGVRWGAFDQLFTPAFWAGRAWQLEPEQTLRNYRLGPTLAHETAACILGGYGIPAEVGLAAYRRLQQLGIPERTASADEIASLLLEPLPIGGRLVRYRFARRKAEHLAGALGLLRDARVEHLDDRGLRTFLTGVPGIGPKTASWITRNWRDSDAVAILDIHICRACVLAGVFGTSADPARDYFRLEDRFLAFAAAIDVRASILDNLMWQTMRRLGQNTRQLMRAMSTLTDDSGTDRKQRRWTAKTRNDFVPQQPETAEAKA